MALRFREMAELAETIRLELQDVSDSLAYAADTIEKQHAALVKARRLIVTATYPDADTMKIINDAIGDEE